MKHVNFCLNANANYYNYSNVLFLQKIVENLCSQHMPKKKEKKESYSWFSWRRKATEGTTPTSAVPRVMSESDVAASKSVSSHVYLYFACE